MIIIIIIIMIIIIIIIDNKNKNKNNKIESNLNQYPIKSRFLFGKVFDLIILTVSRMDQTLFIKLEWAFLLLFTFNHVFSQSEKIHRSTFH